jgi:hypothetical protein
MRQASGMSAGAKIFILSTLATDQTWDAGLQNFAAFQPQQALLGWAAQMRSFGTIMTRLKIPCFVTPAPEMFFTDTTWTVLARTLGLPPKHFASAVHLRFSAGRHARILRGIPNYLASAETAATGVLPTGGHPFRDQNTAPHALAGMLDLTGSAGPLHRPDGTDILRVPIPPGLLTADIPPETLSPAPLTPADFAGLEIISLADAASTTWPLPRAAGPSMHIRRLLLEFQANADKPFLLLPWNLANPASCIPDVVTKLARTLSTGTHAANLLLLPFNATSASLLVPAVAKIRANIGETDEAALSHLFLGAVTDLTVIPLLRRLQPVAWIDGLDPEAAWTEARLNACAIPTLTLRYALTEPTMTEITDEFGQRFVAGFTLPVRDCLRLIAQTRTVRDDSTSAVPPIAPYSIRRWRSWLKKFQPD